MPTPDFVFLNRQAVRATALTPREDGGLRLVVVARGSTDRDHLLDLLRDPGLVVDLGDGAPRPMIASGIDIRTNGDEPQAFHRIEATLHHTSPEARSAPKPASDARPAAAPGSGSLEHRLDTIIALLTDIRDTLNQRR